MAQARAQPRVRSVALAAAATLLFALWTLRGWGGPTLTLWVLDLATLAAAGWATWACWRRARGGATDRHAWLGLALAAGAWALGQLAWCWIELVQGRPVPSPSLPDAGYGAFVVLAASALLVALNARVPGLSRARATLDAALLMTAALVVVWPAAVAGAFADGSATTLARAVNLLYPLGDAMALALAFFVLAMARPEDRAPVAWVCLGLGLFAAADAGFFDLTGTTYTTGTLLDAGWFAGLLALGLAAGAPGRLEADIGAPTMGKGLLAYGPSLGAAAFLGVYVVLQRRADPVLVALALALLALTALRGLLGLAENVLLRGRLEASLQEADEAQRQRTAVLHAVTHELRNPLVPVRLHLEILVETLVENEPARRRLVGVQENLDRVQRLLDDLGELARIEGHRLQVVPVPHDLAPRLQAVAAGFRDGAERARVGLRVEVAPPLEVVADGDRVAQVVHNFLSNALKFTPSGGNIVLRALREEGPHGQVLVEVTDSGRGLTAQEADRLFRPFVQVHDPAKGQSRERGTGLGLFICKSLIEAHGGQVGVRSAGPGMGSTFWFRLPPADAAGAVPGPAGASVGASPT